ncbi:MAG: nucleotide exchange factor GrpE [Pyrinomonadaceae bacterium]
MDPKNEIDDSDVTFELADDETADESNSVDDFIRELEEKEKDLHITAETTFIEIAADFEDPDEIPDFMRQDLAAGKVTVRPAAAAAPGPDPAAQAKLTAEVAALKAKIAGLEDERKELYQKSQRRLNDFEAYKSRTDRERSETFQRQLSNLATQMLPALDNLDRALEFASGIAAEQQDEFAQFFNGIVLVNQQVNEVLVNMGIDPIAAVGHPFDPHFHEAVAVDESSTLPPNTVTGELLRGFRIGEKVIRHAMVRVSKAADRDRGEANQANVDEEPPHIPDESLSNADGGPEAEVTGEASNGIDLLIERNGE